MKVAILTESKTDDGAVHILVSALLGMETERFDPKPKTRGWPAVDNFLPSFLQLVHYRTDVDALAVIVDSDNTTKHDLSHDEMSEPPDDCRMCKLRGTIRRTVSGFKPLSGKPALLTAVGVAVPCIEAWLLVGRDPNVRESVWTPRPRPGLKQHTCDSLKTKKYGSHPRPKGMVKERTIDNALRIAKDLPGLEDRFPVGFGTLANDVRGWRDARSEADA
jgi:hypothetical protein